VAVERARVGLDLPPSAVAGCTDEQIDEVVEAQQVRLLPAPLDELLRVAGVPTGAATSSGSRLANPIQRCGL
jgi:hypothetical protein